MLHPTLLHIEGEIRDFNYVIKSYKGFKDIL